jgi:chemotaxis-related protein WspD
VSHDTSSTTLFDRPLPEDYRREWTTQVAGERSTTVRQTQSALVFRIGAEWLSLPVVVFEGVVPRRPVHTLPHHRGGIVLGLVTLRGQLRLSVSLAKLLGIPEAAESRTIVGVGANRIVPRCVIIGEQADRRVVVPVDEVYGVVRYSTDMVRELPATLAAGTRYTTNVLLWNERTVAQLDSALVLYAIERAIG